MTTNTISQSLFDETLLENEETFDLSPTEALRETIDQFLRQLGVSPDAAAVGTNDGDEADADETISIVIPPQLAHLVLLHPSSPRGQALRQERAEFESCLNTLDQCVNIDGSITLPANIDSTIVSLQTVTHRLKEKENSGYSCIFKNGGGIYTLMSFLGMVKNNTTPTEEETRLIKGTVEACLTCLTVSEPIRTELKDLFVSSMNRLVSLTTIYLNKYSIDNKENAGLAVRLLQLATLATKSCESAKVSYVRSNGISVLSLALNIQHRMILESSCQLLASLCRYDDFREGVGPMNGVSTSCAHDHALEMHRAGLEGRLVEIARDVLKEIGLNNADNNVSEDGSGERLAVAALTALRVLAVNDDIIQTMVALGVLPVVTTALELGCQSNQDMSKNKTESEQTKSSRLAAASLGLLRNLCGNDEIKTNLCLGSSDPHSVHATPSALPHIITAMKLYPTVAILQEHACGTLAAMSLRKPSNAKAIIHTEGPRYILSAMKRHDANPSVQRQGALAVRNLVSRLLRECPEEDEGGKEERNAIRDVFLELGAEDILRNVTGRHQGSVDEAYAALRDLGCSVSLIKYDGEEKTVMHKTRMFGEKHNSNFRPVYEDSAGLEKGVDEAISQFGL